MHPSVPYPVNSSSTTASRMTCPFGLNPISNNICRPINMATRPLFMSDAPQPKTSPSLMDPENFRLLLDAGFAADQFGSPGSASLAMNMLDEGTASRSSLDISEQLALLGAQLSTGANLDLSMVSLSAIKDKLDPSLDIFADVILNPAFPQTDFDRLKQVVDGSVAPAS